VPSSPGRQASHLLRRTNKYGVQRFRTFGAKVPAQFGEHVSMGAAIGLLSVDTVTLASNHIDSWGWVVAFGGQQSKRSATNKGLGNGSATPIVQERH